MHFRTDMRAARRAVHAYDTTGIATSIGAIETIVAGEGFPDLSIHGTGGSFDQGFALASTLHDAGYRVIAPSRFGSLGAPLPAQTDARAQADVFAELLDGLGVEKAVIMGASAGAITALAFAERHPDRTAALLAMVPAYYASDRAAPAPWSPLRIWAVTTALGSDFLFWAGIQFFPTTMAATVLASDRALIEDTNRRNGRGLMQF